MACVTWHVILAVCWGLALSPEAISYLAGVKVLQEGAMIRQLVLLSREAPLQPQISHQAARWKPFFLENAEEPHALCRMPACK